MEKSRLISETTPRFFSTAVKTNALDLLVISVRWPERNATAALGFYTEALLN